jgi:small-conductance mechanosensitive channel
MQWLYHYLHYPISVIGTIVVIVLAGVIEYAGNRYIDRHVQDPREHYRKRSFLTTIVTVAAAVAIIILWARLFENRGTFFGLVGAGVAVALREPLLSIVSRLAIFAGHIYTVGDRIEVEKMTGDVIDVGFFYTRLMELGNWIGGDQVTGRIVQISNSQVFGKPVFNYTRNFSYIWDEVCLPITYSSNMQEATRILTDVGGEYTKDFLQGAQREMEQMQRYFLVPKMEVEPQVYVKITSNWLQLTMRYIVEPKKRRQATSFIYTEVFKRVQQRNDIQIASETMDLTVRRPKQEGGEAETQQPAA